MIDEFNIFKVSYAKLELELQKCGDANDCLELKIAKLNSNLKSVSLSFKKFSRGTKMLDDSIKGQRNRMAYFGYTIFQGWGKEGIQRSFQLCSISSK